MATTPRSQDDITRTDPNYAYKPTEHGGMSSGPAAELIGEAIWQALQTMLRALRITLQDQAEIPPLQRRLLQIKPPRRGFNITVPNPAATGGTFMLPVTPSIRWQVLSEAGEILSPGDRFVAAPLSMDTLREHLLFFPQVVKDELDGHENVFFKVRASISLTAAHPTTGEELTVPDTGRLALAPVTISVPAALRIPSILAFFRDANFEPQSGNKHESALVIVPPHSRIASLEDLADKGALGALIQEVGALRTAIEKLPVYEQSFLATLAGNLEGFLDGLSSLITDLGHFGTSDAPGAIRLEKSNSLNIEEILSNFLSDATGSLHWDQTTSLIFIGLRERARFYNSDKLHAGQGVLQIETGEQMCAVIDRLGNVLPTASIGDPTITVLDPASLNARHPDTPNNAFFTFDFGRNSSREGHKQRRKQ